MLVALSMRVAEAENYIERRDSISHDWIERLNSWNYMPVPVPNGGNPVALLRELKPSLLILTGGDDLGLFPERDATEKKLLGAAMQSGTPVLGVCRGLQQCLVQQLSRCPARQAARPGICSPHRAPPLRYLPAAPSRSLPPTCVWNLIVVTP